MSELETWRIMNKKINRLKRELAEAQKDAEKWLLVKPFVEVAPSMLDHFLWTYRMKPTGLVGQDMEFTTWINKLSDASEAMRKGGE